MPLTSEFVPLELGELRREAALLKADGWRFIQTHAVSAEGGADLYYSFMRDGHIVNYRVAGVPKGTPVPSITDLFLAAFVFENEARELFGVDMRDIAIDFAGAMYAPAESEPMTYLSPEQKAARDKALKAAAAKAAKAAAASGDQKGEGDAAKSNASQPAGKRVFVMTPELQARLDAKYPSLSDEKKAKVDAALAARKAEAESSATGAAAPEPADEPVANEGQPTGTELRPEATRENSVALPTDSVLEQKLASMDPAKAARIRAALAGEPVAKAPEAQLATAGAVDCHLDAQVDALLGLMDEAKAATVRAALTCKGGK